MSFDQVLCNAISGYSSGSIPLFTVHELKEAVVMVADSLGVCHEFGDSYLKALRSLLSSAPIKLNRWQYKYDSLALLWLLTEFKLVAIDKQNFHDGALEFLDRLSIKVLTTASSVAADSIVAVDAPAESIVSCGGGSSSGRKRPYYLRLPSDTPDAVRRHVMEVHGNLVTALQSEKKRNFKLQVDHDALVAQHADLETRYNDLVVRVDQKNLSASGDYRLWRSRNYGHTNGAAIVQMFQMGTATADMVYRSERRGGAAHLLAGQAAAAAFETYSQRHEWRCIVIHTDAFSSKIARTDCHKLQVTEITIGPLENMSSQLLVPDVTRVSSGTGREFVSNLRHQLLHLSLPTWEEELSEPPFTVFVFVGDDGPDVQAGVRLIKEASRDKPFCAVLRVACYMHRCQTLCKESISTTDSLFDGPATSAQIMRISNVWRSFGHHRKLQSAASKLYPDAAVEAHFSTVIGSVVRTRWASQDGPERKLLRGFFGVTPPLWAYMSAKPKPMMRALAAPDPKPKLSVGEFAELLDDLGAEPLDPRWKKLPEPTTMNWSRIFRDALRTKIDTDGACGADVTMAIDMDNLAEVLRARARRAVEDLASDIFPIKLGVSHISRSPLTHCLMAMQELTKQFNQSHKARDSEVRGDGECAELRAAPPSFIRQAQKLFRSAVSEFAEMLTAKAKSDVGYWKYLFEYVDDASRGGDLRPRDLESWIRKNVCSNAAQLVRRFGPEGAAVSKTTPWSLFDILDQPPHVPSMSRASFLMDVLDKDDNGDVPSDGFTEKFLAWSREGLVSAQSAGLLTDPIGKEGYALLAWLDQHTVPHAQKVESDNSVLRIVTSRAPNLKLDLLSGRHVIKTSSTDLVPKEMYTPAFKSACQRIAVDKTKHARFNVTDIAGNEALGDQPRKHRPNVQLAGVRLQTATRLAARVKAAISKYDVVRLVLHTADGGALASKFWYLCSKFRSCYHGFRLVQVTDSAARLPVGGDALRSAHGNLFDMAEEILLAADWPLLRGTCAMVHFYDDSFWRGGSFADFDAEMAAATRTLKIKLPFRFKVHAESKTVEVDPSAIQDVDFHDAADEDDDDAASTMSLSLEEELAKLLGEGTDDEEIGDADGEREGDDTVVAEGCFPQWTRSCAAQMRSWSPLPWRNLALKIRC